MVGQLCACSHELITVFDDGQRGLRLFAAMLDGMKEAGFEPIHHAEDACVALIGFVVGIPDGAKLSWIADTDLVAHGHKESRDPGGMRAGLDDDGRAGILGEVLLDVGGRIGYAGLGGLYAIFVKRDDDVMLVSEIHSDYLDHGWYSFVGFSLQPLVVTAFR
jgi:hypothetical protein